MGTRGIEKFSTDLCSIWFVFVLEDFKHVFTEYGNCFTFNHGENFQSKNKVSLSGRGLKLLFDVRQVSAAFPSSLGWKGESAQDSILLTVFFCQIPPVEFISPFDSLF